MVNVEPSQALGCPTGATPSPGGCTYKLWSEHNPSQPQFLHFCPEHSRRSPRHCPGRARLQLGAVPGVLSPPRPGRLIPSSQNRLWLLPEPGAAAPASPPAQGCCNSLPAHTSSRDTSLAASPQS